MPDVLWAAPVADAVLEPPSPRFERVRRAVAATVASGLVAALIGDGHPFTSTATLLLVIVVVVGVVVAASLEATSRTVVVVAAVAFAPWIVLRASLWLVVPNAIAGLVLVMAGLSVRSGGTLTDGARGYLDRALVIARGAALAPRRAVVGIQTIDRQGRTQTIRGSVGPIVFGIGLAGAVALVLASGDALFASYLDVSSAFDSVVGRFGMALAAMSLVVAFAGGAAGSRARDSTPARAHTSARSMIILLAPLTLVYVMYVAVQSSSVILGADYVTSRTGVTFAEHARSGFFQLVGVAAVTFVALSMCRPVLRDAPLPHRRTLLAVASIAAVCTLAMVVAAIVKLDLYAQVFGLTMLRLYTTVFAAWLAVAIVIAWVALWRRAGEWVVPLVAVTALVGVLGMNIVQPERVVAEHNLLNTIDDDDFDVDYLVGLGDSAVPLIIAHVDELSPDDIAKVASKVCRDRETGWIDWNLTRSRANRAASEWC